jgi:hypothetical protein
MCEYAGSRDNCDFSATLSSMKVRTSPSQDKTFTSALSGLDTPSYYIVT